MLHAKLYLRPLEELLALLHFSVSLHNVNMELLHIFIQSSEAAFLFLIYEDFYLTFGEFSYHI